MRKNESYTILIYVGWLMGWSVAGVYHNKNAEVNQLRDVTLNDVVFLPPKMGIEGELKGDSYVKICPVVQDLVGN